jgi:hypothetical protein
MRTASGRVVLFLVLVCSSVFCGEQEITASDAKLHVNQEATVCGSVVGVHYASRSKGEPTFINPDKPYPNQVFTILILGSDRPKFENPEQSYASKRVCVSGKKTVSRGVPEIIVREPSAIKLCNRHRPPSSLDSL